MGRIRTSETSRLQAAGSFRALRMTRIIRLVRLARLARVVHGSPMHRGLFGAFSGLFGSPLETRNGKGVVPARKVWVSRFFPQLRFKQEGLGFLGGLKFKHHLFGPFEVMFFRRMAGRRVQLFGPSPRQGTDSVRWVRLTLTDFFWWVFFCFQRGKKRILWTRLPTGHRGNRQKV